MIKRKNRVKKKKQTTKSLQYTDGVVTATIDTRARNEKKNEKKT